MIVLAIVLDNGENRPLSLATVRDPELVDAAAAAAIAESEQIAEELSLADPLLGQIQREETSKLRRVLGLLLPAHPDSVIQ